MRQTKEILLVLLINTVITLVFVIYLRPSFVIYVSTVLLQVSAFLILLLFYYFFTKNGVSRVLAHSVSFLVSYIGFLVILWRINDTSLNEFIEDYHSSKDFWFIGFPFITSNIISLIMKIRNRKS